MKLDTVRKLALSFADTTEEPHHNYGSFRVRGKIFVTIPPGQEDIHVFLSDEQRDLALALDPEFLEPVQWGNKIPCVRVHLPTARKSTVVDLVTKAYEFKAAASRAKLKGKANPAAQSTGQARNAA